MSYPERLEKTKTTYFSLSARMTWGDTIQVFKEINAVNKEINPVISLDTGVARGHNRKILEQRCNKDMRKHFYIPMD